MRHQKLSVTIIGLIIAAAMLVLSHVTGLPMASPVKAADSPRPLEWKAVGGYQPKESGDSYQVKSWAVQWEFHEGKVPDKVWLILSRNDTGASGIAWAYRTPEAVLAIVDMLDKAKAKQQEVWYWYNKDKNALLINAGKEPPLPGLQ